MVQPTSNSLLPGIMRPQPQQQQQQQQLPQLGQVIMDNGQLDTNEDLEDDDDEDEKKPAKRSGRRTQVLLLVVSETGLVYTFTTPKLQPLVTKPEGKNLIQSCLNAPDTDETTICS
ncbi:hypothetical protein G6F21_009405 [Rhizopus arrhizus]|nr:hypothetical protein G6F21_009405 [Rhizopus arrhizus]